MPLGEFRAFRAQCFIGYMIFEGTTILTMNLKHIIYFSKNPIKMRILALAKSKKFLTKEEKLSTVGLAPKTS